MKVSFNWLADHLDLSAHSTAQLSDLLTFAGIEVEGMDGAADALRERDRERAVAAAELGDVAGRGVGDEAEGVEDQGDVEEGFPVGLGGHAALAEFHGLRARR